MVLNNGGEEGEREVKPEEDANGSDEPRATGRGTVFLDIGDELGGEGWS